MFIPMTRSPKPAVRIADITKLLGKVKKFRTARSNLIFREDRVFEKYFPNVAHDFHGDSPEQSRD